MRRAAALLLVLGMLLLLPACGDEAPEELREDTEVASAEVQQPQEGERVLTEEEQQIVDMIEADSAETMGAAPDADDYSWEVLEGESQEDGILITTSVYTLLLPKDWEGHYVAEETNNWLSLYSKENMDAGYGGLLCDIIWTTDEMDYLGLPGCIMLGQVTINQVTYDVAADIIPVPQAPESGALYDQYQAMQDALTEVFQTIDFGDNAEFVPA